MKKLTFTLLLLGVLAPVWAVAATYYVAKTGNDSNSCALAQNQSSPKLTIQAGINCMATGDTLQIKAGTYARPTSNPPAGSSFSSATRIQRFGSDVVTVQGWPAMYNSSVHHIIFDGIIFDATGQGLTETVIIANGAHHIRIINSEIIGSSGTAGLALYETGGFNEILNNRIHHNGSNTALDHGIYVHSAGNLIQGNELDHNAASGIQFYNGGADMGTGNIVRNNLIHDNSTGIISWDLSNALISNNVIFNHPNGQGLSAKNAPGLKIYNNTIVGSGGYGAIIYNSSSVELQNNIIYNNAVNLSESGSSIVKTRNLCNSGCDINANPLFVGTTNFALQSGSPARDAGVNLSPTVVDDFVNTARPQGSAFDIGAYEFSSGSTLPAPSNLAVSP